MALLRINAVGPTVQTDDGRPVETALSDALSDCPEAPVTILIHGFKFSPTSPEHTPHNHILSLAPTADAPRLVSWPRHLGHGAKDAGLAIAFGWEARGSIWDAHRATTGVSLALAQLIRVLHRIQNRPVQIMAHSLGARVALSTLPLIPPRAVGRMVLLATAAFGDEARAALASPAGEQVEVLNVTSRQNWLFEGLLKGLLQPFARDWLAAGGIANAPDNWIDLNIDRQPTRHALRALGYRIPRGTTYICHWSGYLRPGLFPLYRAFFAHPQSLPFTRLRAAADAKNVKRTRAGAQYLPLPSA